MRSLRLHVLYQTMEAPWGGSNTFFRNFIREAKKDPLVELTKKPEDAQIVLTAGHYRGPGKFLKTPELRNIQSGRPIWHPFGHWNCRKKIKIIFRVDGLRKIYAEKSVPADELLLRHLRYADGVIYQSEFSRRCFQSVVLDKEKLSAVIPNGANPEVFFPARERLDFLNGVKLISSGWSTNPRKGFKTIAAFSKIQNVTVRHIGRWPDVVSAEKVELLGARKEHEIGSLLRQAHFLLFPSQDEACPNVVVEALASGLPVLYHASGGTVELTVGNRFGMPLPEDENEMEDFLENAKSRYDEMRKNIEAEKSKWNFVNCYRQYKDMFNRVFRD